MSDIDSVVAQFCSECGQDLTDFKQVFKNSKCCHYLCQACRFFQDTACKQCKKKQLFPLSKLNFEDFRLNNDTHITEKNENCSVDQICSVLEATDEKEDNNMALRDEDSKTQTCGECSKTMAHGQKVFENDSCGHNLCQSCRFVQDSVCKQCRFLQQPLIPLKTINLEDIKAVSKPISNEDKDIVLVATGRKSAQSKHIIPIEGNSDKYKCMVCNRVFKRGNMSYHYSCASGKKPFQCDQCSKTFNKKSHLSYHLLTHSGITPFICSLCGKGFTEESKLRRHEISHKGEWNFTCYICDKKFTTNDILVKHITAHKEVWSFKCDSCPRIFKSKDTLRIHKKKHLGKNFLCEECGKKFTLKSQLSFHYCTRDRFRPYKCSTCGHRFVTTDCLRRHAKTHSTVRDYECSLCNTTFGRKDNLERHMKNLHQETVCEHPSVPVLKQKNTQKQAEEKEVKNNEVAAKNDVLDKSVNKSENIFSQNNNFTSVIVKPKDPAKQPKCQQVSVIKGPTNVNNEKGNIEESSPSESSVIKKVGKLLPYRILPPDKRFLQIKESKHCSPTVMNLKATHILSTTESGESNIQTIVTASEKQTIEDINKLQSLLNGHKLSRNLKMYTVDTQSGLYNDIPPRCSKEDSSNKCFRIIRHTDSVLINHDNSCIRSKKAFKAINTVSDFDKETVNNNITRIYDCSESSTVENSNLKSLHLDVCAKVPFSDDYNVFENKTNLLCPPSEEMNFQYENSVCSENTLPNNYFPLHEGTECNSIVNYPQYYEPEGVYNSTYESSHQGDNCEQDTTHLSAMENRSKDPDPISYRTSNSYYESVSHNMNYYYY